MVRRMSMKKLEIKNENHVLHCAKSVILINPISKRTESRSNPTDLSSSTHVSIKLSNCNYAYITRNDKVHIFISKEEATATSSLGYIFDVLEYINVRKIIVHVPRLYDYILLRVYIAAKDHRVKIISERFEKPIEFWDSRTWFRLHPKQTTEITVISNLGPYDNFEYVTYDYYAKSFVRFGENYSFKERARFLKGES